MNELLEIPKIKNKYVKFRILTKEEVKLLSYREKRNYFRARWINNNKEKSREYQLKWKYKINLNKLKLMLEEQNYKCAICLKNFNPLPTGRYRKSPHQYRIDHNHKTKKIRGLLCSNCNSALGKFKESEFILLNAINYLNRYKS